MATSADRDERDEKDDAAEDEESAGEHEKDEKAAAAGSGGSGGKGATKGRPAAASKKADETEADGEDEEEEDEEAEPPPPKPAPKRPAFRGPGAGRARKGATVAPSGSLGKSVLLFFVIVIGLGAGFAILGREQVQETARPKWTAGQVHEVEITIVRSDRQDLGCASSEEIAGKHCAFETTTKPWSKGDVNDDKTLLKPYTTLDRVQFTAAGLWSDPALAPDKLPATRFSVKCKYKVEGTLKNLSVRWEQTGTWFPNVDWYAGSVSDCKISP